MQAGQPELLHEIRDGPVELFDDRARLEREVAGPQDRLADPDVGHDEQELQGEGGMVDDLHHHMVEPEDAPGDQAAEGGRPDEGIDRDGEADRDGGRNGFRRGALAQLSQERVAHLAS